MKTTVSVTECAKIMGIDRQTVIDMILDGRLEAHNTGKKYLITWLSIPTVIRNAFIEQVKECRNCSSLNDHIKKCL